MAFSSVRPDRCGIHKASSPTYMWGGFPEPNFLFKSRPVSNLLLYLFTCGSGSSVGIVTDYGLDGPGSNPGGDEIFRSSRPALGPTQPPVKWVQGLSLG